MPRNTPRSSTQRQSNSSTGVSASGPATPPKPASLKMQSSRPNRSAPRPRRARRLRGSPPSAGRTVLAERAGKAARRPACRRSRRALFHEEPHGALADAARAPGYDRHLPSSSPNSISSMSLSCAPAELRIVPRARPPGNAQRKKCVNALVSVCRYGIRSSRRAT